MSPRKCFKKISPQINFQWQIDDSIVLNSFRENEIFNHNEEYNVFFDNLISLVAESIAQIPVAGEILLIFTTSENLTTQNAKITTTKMFYF